MYAYFKGKVANITADTAVVEAAGVGYELHISSKTADKISIGEECLLYAHLHLADGIQALYGFYTEEERTMFRQLITVTRVGPKLALSVLSQMTPQDVVSAVATETAAAFDSVPGMGRKTAQRVILELKEKLKEYFPVKTFADIKETNIGVSQNVQMDAVAALISLGYDGLTASKAVSQVADANSVEMLITKALRKLATL